MPRSEATIDVIGKLASEPLIARNGMPGSRRSFSRHALASFARHAADAAPTR
ncbi:hypothetical protein AS9A_P20021 (plasmid) [Hoyosella subflava DQS3-9A1]|uniref:Uncharacterized protein n=1 Tax=Hoyosella subflava (strain DSM 45089 / JCM 17490 / NBRC 109087 / DQS3-9A1) TaxID=443218 RepID=F6ESE4_HOYSD|nr:hypothetical protein AS9A_P20021 [Hoyosella subflava DQS3-9A1]